MKHEIKLPFSGFYESIDNSLIDDELVSIAGVDSVEDLSTETYDDYNWPTVYKAYAKLYTSELATFINNNEYISNISLEFKELDSPREYNFRTDYIYAEISTSDLRSLYNHVMHKYEPYKDKLIELVKESGTSRSGYAAMVSPDLDDWGDVVNDWSAHQRELLIQSLDCMDNDNDYPVELDIMDHSIGNGDITNCLYEGEKRRSWEARIPF